jgi:hypothetical protein
VANDDVRTRQQQQTALQTQLEMVRFAAWAQQLGWWPLVYGLQQGLALVGLC